MRGASGLDAIRPIKALARSTQVLMLTTCFDDEAKKRALTNGASDFLLKRYPVERILASIQQALKHPAPHLKHSRRPSVAAARRSETHSPRRPPKRRVWLEYCLDKFRLRRN
jgi:DNA-binding NarL/FixJ family response regulator